MDVNFAYPHFKKHRALPGKIFDEVNRLRPIMGDDGPYTSMQHYDEKTGSGKYKTLPYFGSQTGSGDYKTLPFHGQAGSGTDLVFPNEHHLKMFGHQRHNFTGPGTQVLLREQMGPPYNTPVNALDACSRSHDLSFTDIGSKLKSGSIDRDTMRKLVRDADREYVDCARKAPSKDFTEQAEKYVAGQVIKGKMALESVGILNPDTFIKDNSKPSVGGSLFKYGNRKLHHKKQQGDGIPAILLGALASYVVPKVLETIYEKFKGK